MRRSRHRGGKKFVSSSPCLPFENLICSPCSPYSCHSSFSSACVSFVLTDLLQNVWKAMLKTRSTSERIWNVRRSSCWNSIIKNFVVHQNLCLLAWLKRQAAVEIKFMISSKCKSVPKVVGPLQFLCRRICRSGQPACCAFSSSYSVLTREIRLQVFIIINTGKGLSGQ